MRLAGAAVLQNMDMMREAIEQRASETLAAEYAGPFLKGKIRRDAESNNIVAGDDIFTTGQFENERLVEHGMAVKSNVSKLFTAGKRAARMRRSTMRLSRSMSSSSARRRR